MRPRSTPELPDAAADRQGVEHLFIVERLARSFCAMHPRMPCGLLRENRKIAIFLAHQSREDRCAGRRVGRRPAPRGTDRRSTRRSSHDTPTRAGDQTQTAAELEAEWAADPRWNDVRRDYTADDVIALRGPVREEHTLARRGAEKLWELIQTTARTPRSGSPRSAPSPATRPCSRCAPASQAIYLSRLAGRGRRATSAGRPTPTRASTRPTRCRPSCAASTTRCCAPAQIEFAETGDRPAADWMAPIVADAEAGFGGPLNAYELMLSMIEAGAAGVHWEDQLASEKKCGHMGGKVLIPTGQHIRTLNAARLAADVAGVPSIIIARTDSLAATLLTSDHDERDRPFLTGDPHAPRASTRCENGIGPVLARGHAYAAVRRPALGRVRRARPRARAHLRREHPLRVPRPEAGVQLLAQLQLEAPPRRRRRSRRFQRELSAMGYAFQFITLAGFHSLNHGMFELATGYARPPDERVRRAAGGRVRGRGRGYTATKHQREVGTGYFDRVATALNPDSATLALVGSTESAQFH